VADKDQEFLALEQVCRSARKLKSRECLEKNPGLQAYCMEMEGGEIDVSYSRVMLYMGTCGDNDKYNVPETDV